MSRSFDDLVALQARLRAPGGCPWDREQTHHSLRTYLVEEAYEVLDALEQADDAKLADELGDLLLQIVFHAQIGAEEKRFTIGDVIERIHTKLVRRHPHVFGDVEAATSAEVLKNWEQLKAEERHRHPRHSSAAADGSAESLLDGVPRNQPALLEAFQLTRRAATIGFDWENVNDLLGKLKEEEAELRKALAESPAPSSRVEDEVGDLLFVAVNLARFLGLDPEVALKKANRKFSARFREMERHVGRSGRQLAGASRDEMENLWERSKSRE